MRSRTFGLSLVGALRALFSEPNLAKAVAEAGGVLGSTQILKSDMMVRFPLLVDVCSNIWSTSIGFGVVEPYHILPLSHNSSPI